MKLFTSLMIICSILLSGCNKSENVNNDSPLPECDISVVVDADLYQNAPADEFYFQSVTIDDNCLKISVQYGGGCEDVIFQLFDASSILKSLPLQRNIRLSLEDNDFCEALITKKLDYDLMPLQVEGYAKIILNLQGFEGNLVYNY